MFGQSNNMFNGANFGDFFSNLCREAKTSTPSGVDSFSCEEEKRPDYSEYVHYKKDYEDLLEEFSQYKKRVQNTLDTEKRLLKRNLMKDFLNGFVLFLVNTYKGKKNIGNSMTEEDYLILKKMNDFLDSMGVVPMEDASGKEFDYGTMEAVYSDRDTDVESGHVSKVIYNGFTMDGEVLLPQRVAVSAKNQ